MKCEALLDMFILIKISQHVFKFTCRMKHSLCFRPPLLSIQFLIVVNLCGVCKYLCVFVAIDETTNVRYWPNWHGILIHMDAYLTATYMDDNYMWTCMPQYVMFAQSTLVVYHMVRVLEIKEMPTDRPGKKFQKQTFLLFFCVQIHRLKYWSCCCCSFEFHFRGCFQFLQLTFHSPVFNHIYIWIVHRSYIGSVFSRRWKIETI